MTTKRRILFIINPISGGKKKKDLPALIERIIDQDQFDSEIKFTEYPGHAKKLAAQASQSDYYAVAIAGGDGSINEAANALLYSKTALAIIPFGSGNGLARHLKIPLKTHAALKLINDHQVVAIDSVQVNEHTFFNVGGAGFDAHVAGQFATFGKRGFISYLRLVVRELMNYKEAEYEIIADGKKVKEKAFLLSIANSNQYGNNAFINPSGSLQDGTIEICLLKKIPFHKALLVGYNLLTRNIGRSKYWKMIPVKEAHIIRKDQLFHYDGEPMEIGQELTVKVKPLSLKILVSPNLKSF